MGYYVYENWTTKQARVHTGSCSYCNRGQGTRRQDSGRNGRWLPSPGIPFTMREEPFQRAKATGWENVKGCEKCEP